MWKCSFMNPQFHSPQVYSQLLVSVHLHLHMQIHHSICTSLQLALFLLALPSPVHISLIPWESPETRVPEWSGCVCMFIFAKDWELPDITKKSIFPASDRGKAESDCSQIPFWTLSPPQVPYSVLWESRRHSSTLWPESPWELCHCWAVRNTREKPSHSAPIPGAGWEKTQKLQVNLPHTPLQGQECGGGSAGRFGDEGDSGPGYERGEECGLVEVEWKHLGRKLHGC